MAGKHTTLRGSMLHRSAEQQARGRTRLDSGTLCHRLRRRTRHTRAASRRPRGPRRPRRRPGRRRGVPAGGAGRTSSGRPRGGRRRGSRCRPRRRLARSARRRCGGSPPRCPARPGCRTPGPRWGLPRSEAADVGDHATGHGEEGSPEAGVVMLATRMSPGWSRPKSRGPAMTRAVAVTWPRLAPMPRMTSPVCSSERAGIIPCMNPIQAPLGSNWPGVTCRCARQTILRCSTAPRGPTPAPAGEGPPRVASRCPSSSLRGSQNTSSGLSRIPAPTSRRPNPRSRARIRGQARPTSARASSRRGARAWAQRQEAVEQRPAHGIEPGPDSGGFCSRNEDARPCRS